MKKIILALLLLIAFGVFAYLGNRPDSFTSSEECLQHATLDQSCTKKLFAWVIIDNTTKE